ncbi:MAG: helix-turn-helix domain-containing protein [Solirubrobacterales bacterium]
MRVLRERTSLSQFAAGKGAELSQGQIRHIERGRVDPTWGNTQRAFYRRAIDRAKGLISPATEELEWRIG